MEVQQVVKTFRRLRAMRDRNDLPEAEQRRIIGKTVGVMIVKWAVEELLTDSSSDAYSDEEASEFSDDEQDHDPQDEDDLSDNDFDYLPFEAGYGKGSVEEDFDADDELDNSGARDLSLPTEASTSSNDDTLQDSLHIVRQRFAEYEKSTQRFLAKKRSRLTSTSSEDDESRPAKRARRAATPDVTQSATARPSWLMTRQSRVERRLENLETARSIYKSFEEFSRKMMMDPKDLAIERAMGDIEERFGHMLNPDGLEKARTKFEGDVKHANLYNNFGLVPYMKQYLLWKWRAVEVYPGSKADLRRAETEAARRGESVRDE